MRKHASNALTPFLAEGAEVRIALVEPAPHAYLETVALVADEIDGHADRKVAPHRRIERDEDTLCGVHERRRRSDHAIDDWFSVLGFPGLQKRRIEPRLDEIAFGVDAEETHRLALDLAAEDERCVEMQLGLFQVSLVAPLDVSHGIGDDHGHVEHRARGPEVGSSV